MYIYLLNKYLSNCNTLHLLCFEMDWYAQELHTNKQSYHVVMHNSVHSKMTYGA